MSEQAPLIADVVPELAAEIERELRAFGDTGLAEQVADLRMTKSCGCGDEFCSSFYTGAHPKEDWEGDRRCESLNHRLLLDVLDGEIGFVEVLFRDDLRPRIRAIFGEEADWRLRQEQADRS